MITDEPVYNADMLNMTRQTWRKNMQSTMSKLVSDETSVIQMNDGGESFLIEIDDNAEL